jgi:hypothetical protein
MTALQPRHTVLALFVLVGPLAHQSLAQVAFELGGQVGVGCTVNYDPCDGLLVGGYGGVWIGEHFAARARYSVFEPDGRTEALRVDGKPEALIVTFGRRRQLLLAEPVYRFRPDQRVRPYVGLSFGIRVDNISKRCERLSCDEITAQFGEQVTTARHAKRYSGGVISGLSLHPTRWLMVEAMFGVHDWPGENGTTTTEFAILLGVVPWRSGSQGP